MPDSNIQHKIDQCFDRTRIDNERLRELLILLATRDGILLRKIEELQSREE